MLQVNQTVVNKKGQRGIITRIITKSTGYVEVSYDGVVRKEMAFNLTDENGNALKKAPKKQEPKPVSPLQAMINDLLDVNGCVCGDRNSMSYQSWSKGLAKIWVAAREKSNAFIMDVCDTCDRYMRVSDKQAYCLAKFAMENEIKF